MTATFHVGDACTCVPCTYGGSGHPTIQHCAACCLGSLIQEYDHNCSVPEHQEMAVKQFGPWKGVVK